MTGAYNDEPIPAPSAEYSDLVEALKMIAPHSMPPASIELSASGVPDEPDICEYFDDPSPGFVHGITMTGTVYRFGNVPLATLEGDAREAATARIIEAVYRYEVRPVSHEVREDGVVFTWKLARQWHPAFLCDLTIDPALHS